MNRTGHWSSVILGALCLLGSATLPAAAEPHAEGVPLRNVATGHCLNQVGDTDVELAPCDPGSDDKQWQVVNTPNGNEQIKNVGDGSCLGHAGQDDLKLYSCDPNAAGQQWKLPNAGQGNQIQSVANGECVSHIQGTEVGLQACADDPTQQWTQDAPQSDDEMDE